MSIEYLKWDFRKWITFFFFFFLRMITSMQKRWRLFLKLFFLHHWGDWSDVLQLLLSGFVQEGSPCTFYGEFLWHFFFKAHLEALGTLTFFKLFLLLPILKLVLLNGPKESTSLCVHLHISEKAYKQFCIL